MDTADGPLWWGDVGSGSCKQGGKGREPGRMQPTPSYVEYTVACRQPDRANKRAWRTQKGRSQMQTRSNRKLCCLMPLNVFARYSEMDRVTVLHYRIATKKKTTKDTRKSL